MKLFCSIIGVFLRHGKWNRQQSAVFLSDIEFSGIYGYSGSVGRIYERTMEGDNRMRIGKTILLALVFVLAIYGATVLGADKTAVIIDVRTEAEWNAGHLDGALLIPHERVGEGISAVVGDKKTKIYLYCRTGRRTAIAYDVLKKAGYEDVVNLGTMENAAKQLGRGIVK